MAPYFVNSVEVLQSPTVRPSWPEPREPSRVELPANSQKTANARPLPCDIVLERDHILTLRDGVRIRVDIYRPKTTLKVPAIVMWSPYGKSGTGVVNLDRIPFRCGIPLGRLSGYESFEGLDPAEWVPKGYAVVNANARGAGDSEGDVRIWGSGEGRDGHDAIEEIAKLAWCTGKVAMAGNSWLAVCQWFIAAERPPHLACIAPLEGASDHLRENLCRGGIPATRFSQMIRNNTIGRSSQENNVAMLEKYPNCREYWDDKRAQIGRIQVPAYILGSYSTMLHTIGSFRGFEEIPHQEKWITVHATQSWFDLYSEARTKDLQKFFDHYLKNAENGWKQTPPVRLSVLGFNKTAILDLPFNHLPWLPPYTPKVTQQRLHLAQNQLLQQVNGSNYTTMEYSDDKTMVFKYVFSQSTILLGPTRLVVNVSCPLHEDFDVYTQLRKRDKNGNELEHVNIPLVDLGVSNPKLLPNINSLKYLGPNGRLRASKRKVAPELSQRYWQTLAHDEDEKLTAGDIVRMDVWIWPTAISFDPGEQLVLKVAGTDNMTLHEVESLKDAPKKVPTQVLHLGGNYESYLQVFFYS